MALFGKVSVPVDFELKNAAAVARALSQCSGTISEAFAELSRDLTDIGLDKSEDVE